MQSNSYFFMPKVMKGLIKILAIVSMSKLLNTQSSQVLAPKLCVLGSSTSFLLLGLKLTSLHQKTLKSYHQKFLRNEWQSMFFPTTGAKK